MYLFDINGLIMQDCSKSAKSNLISVLLPAFVPIVSLLFDSVSSLFAQFT